MEKGKTMKRVEAYHVLARMQAETFSAEEAQALEIALNDIEFVDLMPNDMVAVVRCKDCEYRMLYGKAPFMYYRCTFGNGLAASLKDDDFCSYGERKEDA